MAHHELWLDEAQHFLIGGTCGTLPFAGPRSLLYMACYDGPSPWLWNGLLYLITAHFYQRPENMAGKHAGISPGDLFRHRHGTYFLPLCAVRPCPIRILVLCRLLFHLRRYELVISRRLCAGDNCCCSSVCLLEIAAIPQEEFAGDPEYAPLPHVQHASLFYAFAAMGNSLLSAPMVGYIGK